MNLDVFSAASNPSSYNRESWENRIWVSLMLVREVAIDRGSPAVARGIRYPLTDEVVNGASDEERREDRQKAAPAIIVRLHMFRYMIRHLTGVLARPIRG